MFALVLVLSALAGLVFGCCALFGLRERTWWSALLVGLGPAVDAGLTAWLLHWLGLGPVLTVLAAAIVGLRRNVDDGHPFFFLGGLVFGLGILVGATTNSPLLVSRDVVAVGPNGVAFAVAS